MHCTQRLHEFYHGMPKVNVRKGRFRRNPLFMRVSECTRVWYTRLSTGYYQKVDNWRKTGYYLGNPLFMRFSTVIPCVSPVSISIPAMHACNYCAYHSSTLCNPRYQRIPLEKNGVSKGIILGNPSVHQCFSGITISPICGCTVPTAIPGFMRVPAVPFVDPQFQRVCYRRRTAGHGGNRCVRCGRGTLVNPWIKSIQGLPLVSVDYFR